MRTRVQPQASAPRRPALPQLRPPPPLPAAASALCRGSWRAPGPCPGPSPRDRHDPARAACRCPCRGAALARGPARGPCPGRAADAGRGPFRMLPARRGAACGRGPLPTPADASPSARRPSACRRAAARAPRRTAARCRGAAGRPCRDRPGNPVLSEACVGEGLLVGLEFIDGVRKFAQCISMLLPASTAPPLSVVLHQLHCCSAIVAEACKASAQDGWNSISLFRHAGPWRWARPAMLQAAVCCATVKVLQCINEYMKQRACCARWHRVRHDDAVPALSPSHVLSSPDPVAMATTSSILQTPTLRARSVIGCQHSEEIGHGAHAS